MKKLFLCSLLSLSSTAFAGTTPCHTLREVFPYKGHVVKVSAACVSSRVLCQGNTVKAHAEFTATLERQVLVVLTNSCTGDEVGRYTDDESVDQDHGFDGAACYPDSESNSDLEEAIRLTLQRCEQERQLVEEQAH